MANPNDQPQSPLSRSSSLVRTAVKGAMAFVAVVGLLLGLHSIGEPRFMRHPCVCHGKQLGIALQNYYDVHKCFPPAYIADREGRPMHSWRVLILPYLEERELYAQYDFNEPWNGPNNGKLANRMPYVYRCPYADDDTNETSYAAVVGPETGWPVPRSSSVRGITDGTSKTISLVEVVESGINWLEPRDVRFDQALRGINAHGPKPVISSNHRGGANVIWFDAHVSFLKNDLKTDLLRGLLTANGREPVNDPNSGQ